MGLGSGIPDPGVKKAPDSRSRIRIRNTARYSYFQVARQQPDFVSFFFQKKLRNILSNVHCKQIQVL